MGTGDGRSLLRDVLYADCLDELLDPTCPQSRGRSIFQYYFEAPCDN